MAHRGARRHGCGGMGEVTLTRAPRRYARRRDRLFYVAQTLALDEGRTARSRVAARNRTILCIFPAIWQPDTGDPGADRVSRSRTRHWLVRLAARVFSSISPLFRLYLHCQLDANRRPQYFPTLLACDPRGRAYRCADGNCIVAAPPAA